MMLLGDCAHSSLSHTRFKTIKIKIYIKILRIHFTYDYSHTTWPWLKFRILKSGTNDGHSVSIPWVNILEDHGRRRKPHR